MSLTSHSSSPHPPSRRLPIDNQLSELDWYILWPWFQTKIPRLTVAMTGTTRQLPYPRHRLTLTNTTTVPTTQVRPMIKPSCSKGMPSFVRIWNRHWFNFLRSFYNRSYRISRHRNWLQCRPPVGSLPSMLPTIYCGLT